MKIFVLKLLFALVLLSIGTAMLNAQTVGLVLSGGGSKGLAHIGVIRALEENNIPIDYVVGTSIGAIIGGLYSIGFSPDEMEALLKEDRFANYYRGNIPDEHYYYYMQLNPTAANFNIGLTKKDSSLSIALPTNLVAAQPMDFGIMEYFAKYTGGANSDFNCLMVPYRCVASDVYNNREMVFNHGDLGMSIRASMTYPFYFKPVEIDSVLYFDGGIYNNFPVDVMRNEFNPDIIIGVVVAGYSEKPNPDDLLLQIENMIMGEEKEYIVPSSEGITINVDFKNVSLFDFSQVDVFETKGYDAANVLMDSIKQLVRIREDSSDLAFRRHVYRSRLPVLKFDKVYISGLDKIEQNYLARTFKKKTDKLDIKQIESEYYKLISDYQIETATPIAKYNDTTGYFDMILDVKKEKRANVLFGASISSGYSNQGFVGFDYRILDRVSLLLQTNLYFGRLYSSINIAGRLDFPTSQPLALEVSANVNRFDYFKGTTRAFSLDFRPSYIINYDNN